MPILGGAVGPIGLAMAVVSAIGVVSTRPAPLCGVLDLSLAPIGKPTAALEKSPTTSRQGPILFMPMLAGQGWAIGWATATGVPVIGGLSIKPAPSCGVLDLSLVPIGKPTAAREKSPTTSPSSPIVFMPMLVGQG